MPASGLPPTGQLSDANFNSGAKEGNAKSDGSGIVDEYTDAFWTF